MTRGLMIAAIALLLCAPAMAQAPLSNRNLPTPPPQVPNTLRLLNQRIPEVSFESVPFEQIMEWVGELTGANVVVRWQIIEDAGIERDKPLTIRVKNLRLSQVLWMIMNEAAGSDVRLAYRAAGSLLILSTQDDLGQEMIVKVYDVADLLTSAPRFNNAATMDPAQALNQSGGQGGGGGNNQLFQSNQNNQNESRDQEGTGTDIQVIIDLIQGTVEPDSWVANGGLGHIHPFNKSLVVYNSLLVHQQIGGYVQDEAVGP
ncbi:MAG: hypothetical protein PVJ57_01465 [Phycisphaerae bacterium]|jgi:hypothetical protein